LAILVNAGIAGLTIEAMCQHLSVTKGSFYHHFQNLQDFQAQLLAFWGQEDTERVIAAASDLESDHFGVEGLIQVLSSRSAASANPELAIRAWARQDEAVKEFVAQIDWARLELLLAFFREEVRDGNRADRLAQMLYTMLVGSYSVLPPIEGQALLALFEEFKTLY
jgi:AcrR family transcriptional regulator